MQELEKILEEIDNLIVLRALPCTNLIEKEKVEEIIRMHMNGDWIPVEEHLPEIDEDTEDDDCPEYNVTIRGASESTTLKYSPDGTWFDDNGYVYSVIAWRPLPEPYRPESIYKPRRKCIYHAPDNTKIPAEIVNERDDGTLNLICYGIATYDLTCVPKKCISFNDFD